MRRIDGGYCQPGLLIRHLAWYYPPITHQNHTHHFLNNLLFV